MALMRERGRGVEALDSPDCDPVQARREYRFLAPVNRLTGAAATVRRYLRDEAARLGKRRLRVLDIGAGGGDLAAAMLDWARGAGVPLHLTCLEPNRQGRAMIRRRLRRRPGAGVEVCGDDVFAHRPDRPYDLAVAALVLHHFSDARAIELAARLRQAVRHSLLVSDLRRDPLHYAGAWLLTRGAPAATRRDALLSIRRGFRPAELAELLTAGAGAPATARRRWLFRVAAVVRYDAEQEGTRCP